ncbi:MAG TPA: DUF1127 domain-containing protein [Stellaceae bacterium]|nr:DUF1127 domain-containing protein [Stellaceae bacterium]
MLRQLLDKLAAYRRQQRALEELYALDDRSLADIGITRSEIPYLVSQRKASDQGEARAPFKTFRHA